jgi:ribosomal protein L18
MIQRTNKNEIRGRIHKRIRSKVRGTPERPRLAIFRSLSHIYAQIIDDTKNQTLVAAASSEKTLLDGAASVLAPPVVAKAEAPKSDKGEKGEKSDKPEKSDGEKSEKRDKREKGEKAAKSDKGDKGDKGDKPDKGEKKAANPIAKARGGNVPGAELIGKAIAQRAKEKGIQRVVFDRGGYLYHGRVKALADAARKAGLEF